MELGDDLDDVLAAWRLSASLHTFAQPASADDFIRAEVRLGRPLPAPLTRFLQATNGGEFLDGNLSIRPLFADPDGGILDFADDLRASEWPVADELIVLGTDGTGDPFGLWYPSTAMPGSLVPIVNVGTIFEPGCMALGGTDLGRFLRGVSAYYLVLLGAPAEALDILRLPHHLRDRPGPLDPYVAWADPLLPDPRADPYAARLDEAGVATAVASLA